ncbi:hypothetical protein [Psychrobacillus psychrotolerans]|uniref:hypothetical protein n=1 Tax=Psychrobacillus psychrotolerans TaxID=126156 RepID=UPI003B010740
MKITSKYFENEKYSCRNCKSDYLESQVNTDNWRCDGCGKKVSIDIGARNKLVRLLPSEMTEYDSVYDQYSKKFHDLKGINILKRNYLINVEEYRGIPVNKGEFVNCMWNDQ